MSTYEFWHNRCIVCGDYQGHGGLPCPKNLNDIPFNNIQKDFKVTTELTPAQRHEAVAREITKAIFTDGDVIKAIDHSMLAPIIAAHVAQETESLIEQNDGLCRVLDELEIKHKQLQARVKRLEEALIRLRDCDWVISLPDRMDAVRDIARAALAAGEKVGG